MTIELISPVELPSTMGKWFWERRDDFEHAVITERRDDAVVLRLDVDPPSTEEGTAEGQRDGYVYVEIDGEALFAETAQRAGDYSIPTIADFRSGLREARGLVQSECDSRVRYERELGELQRFKQSTMTGVVLAVVAIVATMLLRSCA